MADTENEVRGFFVKAGMYIFGILLGLGVKLVSIGREKKLTLREYINHSIIAFASAFLVWQILSYYGRLDVANVASVVVGRYGDAIIYTVWEKIKEAIKSKKVTDE
jgi:hypothetical protein